MTCTNWRGIEARINWMLDHPPGEPGMCARESWQALGGDQSPPCPPAWGTPNANAVYDNVAASGRYWTSTPIPRGALIVWKYGQNGHAALSAGDGKIVTTDPTNDPGGTGIEPLSYPERWGATSSKRIWTDQYNLVRFAVGSESLPPGPVYVSKLVYGQDDSDSVSRLQDTLNGVTLSGGSTLPVTGFYGDQTANEVGLWQTQKATDRTVVDGSHVSPAQAEQLFTGTGHTVINDVTVTEPPIDPEEPDVPASDSYFYSGKPSGTFTFGPDYKKLDLPAWAPSKDGLILGMIYLNVAGSGEFRVRVIRDPDDASAYLTVYPKSGDNFLLTHCWFEMAEAGRKLWWEVQSMDGETMNIGTRYCKWTLIG